MMEILEILGFVVTIISLIIAFWQYSLYKRQMRIEQLSKYSARFCKNSSTIALAKYLNSADDGKLTDKEKIPDNYDIEIFMRYFEELELLIRAKSIDEKLVSYMYSHYIIKFDDLKTKWSKVKYSSDKWKIFRELVSRMRRIKEDKTNYNI